MTWTRIAAIFFGAVVAMGLQTGLAAPWYVSFPVGILGYFIIRYAGWAINERRRLNREMDEVAAKVKRGEPLDL